MDINAVDYGLEVWKGMLASTCALFTGISTSFIPVGRLVASGSLEDVISFYDSLGGEFADAVRDTLVFDALTYNEDRHFGNLGVLADARSAKVIAPAPLFDHGMSLFHYAMRDDYVNLDEYAKMRTPAYTGTTFEQIVEAVITPRQVEKLRKILSFSFIRHKEINLPDEDLKAIEVHLRKRAAQLLEIAVDALKTNAVNVVLALSTDNSGCNGLRVLVDGSVLDVNPVTVNAEYWNLSIKNGRLRPLRSSVADFPVIDNGEVSNSHAWVLGQKPDGQLRLVNAWGVVKDTPMKTAVEFYKEFGIANAVLIHGTLIGKFGLDFDSIN
jgi:hypothetical protein